MVKKKRKNTKLHTGRLFWDGGGTSLASNYSALGNQYRAQGLFPGGTNNVNNWKPEYKPTGNSIDGGKSNDGGESSGGDSGGSALGTASQIGGLIGMFDSLAASASNAFDSGRAGTSGKPQVLVEGVLGGQSGSHLANMWGTGAKTADAINYVNNTGNVEFASNNSDNLLAAHSGVGTMENLNIDTKGKEWQDALLDPISYITTRWILKTRETAKDRQARINEAISAANSRQEASYTNAVNSFAKNQARNVAANYRASGGPLGLDPFLKERFPDEPSLEERMKYQILREAVPGMPAVYPYDFKSRTKAQRAINAERQSREFSGRMKERADRRQRILERLDEFDNKYLGDRFIRQYNSGPNVGEFDTKAFGGPMYGYMSDGAIAYDMARDNLMVKMLNAQNKNQAQPTLSFAAGGLLSDNFTNGVTTIGAGGSHESNPYSGVPMGMAEDGQPNLVEEGEAIYNDYVYSNRLRVPEAVRSKYKLRGPKDMTYAEAFLAAQKESEERENDPISKRGLDYIAGVLAQSQEEVRAKKESRKKAHGGHLYFSGSLLDEPPFDIGSMTPEEFYRINNYWPDGYDPTTGEWATLGDSNWTPEKLASVTGESLSDIASGVAPGSAIRPVATGTGASAPLKTVAPGDKGTNDEGDKGAGAKGSYLSNDVNLLRLAPIAGNVGAVFMDALGITNKPAYYNYIPNYTGIGFSPLGEYVPEFHTDTRYAANQQAQQAAATRNAIMNTTAPSRFASLLAADYNAQNTYGNLLRDAEIADYDNLLKARTFNRATNEFNSEMGIKAAAQDAQERLAYAQAKLAQAKANTDETNASWGARAQNIKGLTTSLGNLGKELDSRDMIKWLTVKGVLGSYSEEDLRGMGVDESVIKEVKGDKYVGTKKAHGGKLRKKRGGFTC